MSTVRAFTDLDCWKLADSVKTGVYALTKDGPPSRDFAFRDQIRKSAASAPANIAEGFGRYEPSEIRPFLRIANGSLMETSNHLKDGVDRGYFTDAEVAPLLRLARRASAATTSWLRYLKTARAPRTREPTSEP